MRGCLWHDCGKFKYSQRVVLGKPFSYREDVLKNKNAPDKHIDIAALDTWRIALHEDAVPGERYAAEELSRFYMEATGIELPVIFKADMDEQLIIIGPGEKALNKLGDEEFSIAIRAKQILVTGGRPRGALYGVYSFLENYMGVRFLSSSHTHVPKIKQPCLIPCSEYRYCPKIEFRWPLYYETNNDPVLATRQRCNTVQTDIETIHQPFMRKPPIAQDTGKFLNSNEKFGGTTSIKLAGHSFHKLLSAEEFGISNPEFFCERNGKRLSLETRDDIHHLQPCLSSTGALEIVTGRVMEMIETDPSRKFIILGQNDNQAYCECAKCAKTDKREESHMGSLLAFVNTVADSVAEKHPDITIGTLAYQYSRKPPRFIQPRPNVYIQLCTIECCLVHPLDDPECPLNRPFATDLKEWSRITSRIGVWNYQTNFRSYMSPCPNLFAMERNVRFLANHNVKALFMQGAYDTPASEFSDMRNYLLNCILWDPSRNLETWRDEFIALHYGKAAGPIRKYIDFVHNRIIAKNLHFNCFGNSNKDYGIDNEIVDCGLSCFQEALALAENKTVRDRVEKASLCALRAAIDPLFQTTSVLAKSKIAEYEPLVREFFNLCKKNGVCKIRESSVKEWRPLLADIGQLNAVIEELEQKHGFSL